MKSLGTVYFFVLTILVAQFSYAQDVEVAQSFDGVEKKLGEKFNKYNQSRDDDERNTLANEIKNEVASILANPNYANIEFKNLKVISVVKSRDESVKLYTWVLPNLVGTYSFYGFLKSGEGISARVYELIDKSDSIPAVDRKMLGPEDWFGAVYYELIEKKINGKKMYTVLGWHPKNALLNSKVIDVVYFDDMGRLKFGAPIFQLPNKIQRRIIFEYSAQASMSLKYHKVRRFLIFKQNMIVFDHLAPPDLALLNQFQYYGPDFSNDALKFKRGKWEYVSDIDARNLK